MLYTIYQVTHRESGKCYIGKHQTNDLNDGYMGSGQLIRAAIKKYGPEAFDKEVLCVFETEEEMNAKEAELVTEEFCGREDTYNLCPGGNGGWGYVNRKDLAFGQNKKDARRLGGIRSGKQVSREHLVRMARISQNSASPEEKFARSRKGGLIAMKGKRHSSDTLLKMREKQSGSRNSQFGTIWISNGSECKKIAMEMSIPDGWRRGRK